MRRQVVRVRGLEPPRAEAHQILSLARLPVPPHPRAFARTARVRASRPARLSTAAGARPNGIGVKDGIRTRDRQGHNLELYQLSYLHHRCDAPRRRAVAGAGLQGARRFRIPSASCPVTPAPARAGAALRKCDRTARVAGKDDQRACLRRLRSLRDAGSPRGRASTVRLRFQTRHAEPMGRPPHRIRRG